MHGLSAIGFAVGLAFALAVCVALQKYLAAKFTLRTSGEIIWIHPFRASALVLGNYFPPKGWLGDWFEPFSPYIKYGSTCIPSVMFWNALPIYWISDAETIRAVQMQRGVFPKDVQAYEPLDIYGQTIVSAEGHDWKRHRASANSAFNESNNNFVWRETCRVVHEWFSEIDRKPGIKTGTYVDIQHDLVQASLLVISSAGFGRPTSWKDDSITEPPPGHKRTFRHALSSTLQKILTKVMIPQWMHHFSDIVYVPILTPHLAETRESFDALKHHMLEVIGLARDSIAAGKVAQMDAALLRNLVEANMSEDGGHHKHLSDNELLSDTFIYFTAGHHTTAHTLCFAIILLALYPDVQRQAYEATCRLWPNDLPPADISWSYKEIMTRLDYFHAIVLETLRLFAPVRRLGKLITGDATLRTHRFTTGADGKIRNVEEYDVSISAGGLVLIDIMALHMNPIHWGYDVADFKPERFIDTDTYRWPRDAFQAFSSGPRSCIGQRFAMIESVCILAHIVRKYEIDVPEKLKDKSWAEQKEVMLKWKPGVTTVPLKSKVIFRRRTENFAPED